MLGWDSDTEELVHLRSGNGKYKLAITIFLYEDHYCVVSDMSRLVSRQLVDSVVHFCNYCCFTHRDRKMVEKHQEQCVRDDDDEEKPGKVMPKPGEKTWFKNYERTIEQAFPIYVDTKSRLVPMEVKFGKGTTQYQEHIIVSYAHQVVSRVDPRDNKFVSYTAQSNDEDVTEHLLKSLEDTTKELYLKYKKSKPMDITEQQQREFELATRCWICGEDGWGGEKLSD